MAEAESTVTLGKQADGQTAPAGLEVVMEAIRLRPDGAWCHLYSDKAKEVRRGDPDFQIEPLVLKSAADARDAEQRAEIKRLRGLLEASRVALDWYSEETAATRKLQAENERLRGLLEEATDCLRIVLPLVNAIYHGKHSVQARIEALTKIGEPR
jgi:hypothetical protein